MKIVATILIMIPVIALPAVAGDHGVHKTESGWFDMENCEFCKHLVEDPGLLEHTHWETHKIDNGAVTIMSVDPEYRESYLKAGKAMAELGEKMMSGEVNPMSVRMCGHCMMYGQIMMAGAEMQEIRSEIADVSIMTADNPDVVKMIHQLVDRNEQEMKLMMAGAESHGHQH
jgi:hypothetical protein